MGQLLSSVLKPLPSPVILFYIFILEKKVSCAIPRCIPTQAGTQPFWMPPYWSSKMESRNLPSKLSRLDDNEKLTLSKGQKTPSRQSWSLPLALGKEKMKTQQARKRSGKVRIPLTPSFISRIKRKRTTIIFLEGSVLSNISTVFLWLMKPVYLSAAKDFTIYFAQH